MITPSRRIIIACLDTSLLIILILLLSPRMTGLKLHEILGIIFFIPLIIHLLIAWRWIRNSIRLFFVTSRRTRFNFFLNVTLFFLVITEIVSGIVISQVALPFIGITTINDRAWRALHNLTLNYTVLFAGLHIAVNWGWIISIFRKRLYFPNQKHKIILPKFITLTLRTCILILLTGSIAFVLYCLLGKPSLTRLYIQDEIARFRPQFFHGIGQLFGESFLIAIVAFVARKWLGVKL